MADWRNLPPLDEAERLPLPEKLSQTILDRETQCPRSAHLYLKHRGGPSSKEMERGNAYHEFAQQALTHLIEVDEPWLPPEVAKDLMQGVLDDPRFVVDAGEADRLRVAAYHFAEGFSVDPGSIVAVEQMFEFDTGGLTLRGKLDLAYVDGDTLCIRDWKSGFNYPSVEDFEGSFQQPFYAVLAAFGVPVTEVACHGCDGSGVHRNDVDRSDKCPVCDGKGHTWDRGLPIGERSQMFDLAEVYPWLDVRDDGMAQRQMFLSRPELIDHRAYVEGVARKLADRFESGDFPAIPGPQCSTCAAPHECPLPGQLRNYRGVVNTEEQAAEALAWLGFQQDRVAAVKKECRNFAKAHGPIRVGDFVWEFTDEESEEWITGKRIGRPDSAAAREAMVEAIDRAIRFGEPFEYSEFRRRRTQTPFRRRKVTPDEKAEPVPSGHIDAEDFGDSPPF